MLLSLILLTGASGGGLWWSMKNKGATEEDSTLNHTVKRADFILSITERGEIVSSDDVEIRCEVKAKNSSGTAILKLVEEGSEVKKGDFLLQFVSTAFEEERTLQMIQVNLSQANVIAAENKYDTAVISKREYLEGTFFQEEQTIKSEIFVAKENLSRAVEYLKYSKKLAGKGYITEQQLEADRFAVEKSQLELEAANTKLHVLQKFTKEKTVTQLTNDIRTAKAKKYAEENSHKLELGKLQVIEDQIKRCTVYAPTDGIVLFAHENGGRGDDDFIVKDGTLVRERQVVFRLPNKAKMQVKLKINESLIKYVRAGAPATIRPVGLSGMELKGIVERVNEYSEPTGWRKQNVKKYGAIVQIQMGSKLLRNGMSTAVTIECDFVPDVLQVPVQAIYPHGKEAYCFVKTSSDTGWEAKKVTRGLTNEKTFVIENGLSENDVVSLNPKKLLSKVRLPKLKKTNNSGAGKPPRNVKKKGTSQAYSHSR